MTGGSKQGSGGERDAHVLAGAQLGGEAGRLSRCIVAADQFRAVVGLPEQIAPRDPAALPMLLNAGSEHGAGRGAQWRTVKGLV